MKARTFRVLAAVVVTACGTGDLTEPSRPLLTTPSAAIEDGANGGGNPDFFFLPPMVDDPSGLPTFLDNALNPSLTPTVLITAAPSYSFQATATFNSTHYVVNWQVPVSSTSMTYRVSVKVGTTELGFADVYAAANGSDLKNADNDVVALRDGRMLPIKFVIENFALCDTPGTGPCSSENVDLASGGEVSIQTESGEAGVTIPPQPGGGNTTVTVKLCSVDDPESGFDDMNPAVTDLPTYGPCLSVAADPPLPPSGLTVPATVFVCDITPLLGSMDPEQQERVTMHRWDAPNSLTALPHAVHVCDTQTAAASVRGFFAALARGSFKAAGRQLTGLLAPRPLYAATVMLDVGAGGSTDEFSAFQFALPAKLSIVEGDNQTAPPGAAPLNPKVIVTDVGGHPVAGARVRFTASLASCATFGSGTEILTTVDDPLDANDGTASTSWTLLAGANTLFACGRGLAGDDNNGPRGFTGDGDGVVDPFQPLSEHFGDASEGPEVAVFTGSVAFNATGAVGVIRISGFANPRNRAPLIDASGTAPTGDLGSSQLVSALNNSAKFGPSGVVTCTVDIQPFVQTISTGSLVSGGSRLVDVFFAGLTATTLTTAEAGELAAFVNAGGILFITGNSAANEGPSYHPLFTALGATTTFGADGSVLGESVSSDPPNTTPFTNGPFGAVGPLSQSIYRPIQPGSMAGLATGATHSEFVLVEGAFGSGRLSAMGDPMYMNQFTGDSDNLNYFLNLFAAGCSVPPPAP